jgi:hypothetical protein
MANFYMKDLWLSYCVKKFEKLGIFQENQLCGGEKVEEQVDRCEAK